MTKITTQVVKVSTPHRVMPGYIGCCTIQAMSTLADRVRATREAAGMTQADLAKSANVTQQTIDKIERGITRNSKFIVEIAAALNVSAAYLKGYTEDPTPEALRKKLLSIVQDLDDVDLYEALSALKPFRKP